MTKRKPTLKLVKQPPGAAPGDGAADFKGNVTTLVTVRPRLAFNLKFVPAPEMRDASIKRLLELNTGDDPMLYNRSGVVSSIDGTSIRMERNVHITNLLVDIADWQTGPPNNLSEAMPPSRLVDMILATAALRNGLPSLDSVTATPTFGADGRFETQPGYHPSTLTYYVPAPGFVLPAVPDKPTDADMAKAKSLILDEVLVDFPFTKDAERAHAVALLVLGLVRPMLEGDDAPMHIFDAPAAGTGKGLLASACAHIITGRPLPVTPEAGSKEEWRKKIFALILEGHPIISFDNLHEKLESSTLAALLTGGGLQDRILGETRTVDARNRSILLGTGNNVSAHFEMPRRIAWTRLEEPEGRPLNRRKPFKNADLIDFIKKNRADLVWSVAVFVRRWIAEKRPAPSWLRPSYEKWSRVVGGVLLTAGIDGFNGNYAERTGEATDPQEEAFSRVVQLWWAKFQEKPVNAAQLHQYTYDTSGDLLPSVRSGDITEVRRGLGRMVKSKVGNRYGDYFVRSTEIKTDGVTWWRLEKVA